MTASIQEISKLLLGAAAKDEILILIGAGLSAPSGIATFRKGGAQPPMWQSTPALSIDDWKTDPERIWNFTEERIAGARDEQGRPPRPVAHLPLAKLLMQMKQHLPASRIQVATQNVDLLLEAAFDQLGAGEGHELRPEILHVHGRMGWRCSSCGSAGDLNERGRPPQRCPRCDCGTEKYDSDKRMIEHGIRPDIVLFGENLPESFEKLWDESQRFSFCLVIGSSLEVTPVGLLPQQIAKAGGHIIVADEVLPERLRGMTHKHCHWLAGDLEQSLELLQQGFAEGMAELGAKHRKISAELREGEELELTLIDTPSTGYIWELTDGSMTAGWSIQLEAVNQPKGSSEGLSQQIREEVAVGGRRKLKLSISKVKEQGSWSTRVELQRRRPWNGETAERLTIELKGWS